MSKVEIRVFPTSVSVPVTKKAGGKGDKSAKNVEVMSLQ
jgi:hypothetical protein